MPHAKDMSSEGGSQTQLFQWGSTSMDDWNQHGYSTTNEGYGVGYSLDRKAFNRKREATPWSTTNNSYGKEILKANSERAGSETGSYGSYLSYRSQPGFKRDPIDLNEDKVPARVALENRIRRGINGSSGGKKGDGPLSLPPLDPSKYLVAQAPLANWQRGSAGSNKGQSEITRGQSNGVYPPAGSSHSNPSNQPDPPPPKTGPARRYMRDTLDRFLMSIPEELRPKTRRQIKPREEPQILKVVHAPKKKSRSNRTAGLPERTTTVMSHAVPSCATSLSSRSSSASSSCSSSSAHSGN